MPTLVHVQVPNKVVNPASFILILQTLHLEIHLWTLCENIIAKSYDKYKTAAAGVLAMALLLQITVNLCTKCIRLLKSSNLEVYKVKPVQKSP